MLVIDTEGDAALEAVISGEMGEEATLRFLKAKLKVMQEEIVDLSTQLKTNRSKASDAEGQLKKLAVAQTKSQKSAESAQAAVAKHKHAAEDAARKYQNEQAQNKLLRKELEVREGRVQGCKGGGVGEGKGREALFFLSASTCSLSIAPFPLLVSLFQLYAWCSRRRRSFWLPNFMLTSCAISSAFLF